MTMNYETIIRSELALRHQLHIREGFDTVAPKLLKWLEQYQGIEAHIAWDDMLPDAAVAKCLRNTATLGMDQTLKALTQLDFNGYVVFLQTEPTGAVIHWNPIETSLQVFDPLDRSWSYRGNRTVVSVEALKQYLFG